MVRAGEAPIKPQYCIPKPSDSDPAPPTDGKKRHRGGGQNKKRRQPFKLQWQDMMCQFVVRGEECPILDKCKKMHDKHAFMTKKGEDLGEECVLYKQFGLCVYGVSCRYATQHTDSDLNNVTNEERYEKMKVYEVQKTLLKDLQNKLRARKVWFKRSYQYFDENKIDYKEELKRHERRANVISNDGKRRKTEESSQKTQENDKLTSENLTQSVANDENNNINSHNKTNSTEKKNTTDSDLIYEDLKEEYYCLKSRVRKTLDLRGKLFLSPLTTVGNLPFRRICKEYGADVTCGEMALSEDLLQANMSEWALLKRHHTEDIFGAQICANSSIKAAKACELINSECDVDFVDLNVGCPIDLIFHRGAGSALMDRAAKLEQILTAMVQVSDIPVSVKMRMGTSDNKLTAISLCERLKSTGISHITVHGRTRQQRYTRSADWDYIRKCKQAAGQLTLFGNGDVLSYEDYNSAIEGADGVMIGRGALVKPWIFKEIKEQRHWDISSTERMEMLRKFTGYGLEHWGTDTTGVEKTRHFMLEWLSFLYRYIPVGVLEVLPQRINHRPPYYHGRDETETLMCSDNCNDWVKLTEIMLGKVPDGFHFLPKHVANSYTAVEQPAAVEQPT